MSHFLLPLSRSTEVTLVDADVYDWAKNIKWLCSPKGYAIHKTSKNYKNVSFSLARMILGLEKGNQLTADHINRNRLDNRRCNLRVCTHQQNTWNRKNNRLNTSSQGMQGVHWWTQRGKWRVDLTVSGKKIHIGVFADKNQAESAYLAARAKAFGEFHYG